MRLKIFIVISVVICFFSCQKKVEIKDSRFRTWLNPDDKIETGFSVILDMTVVHDDVFKIYYTESSSEDFQEKKSLQSKIKGSDKKQLITFNLSKEIKPKNLRIDFGINKKQNHFQFNSIKLNNPENNLEIRPDKLFDYFEIFNKNLSYDTITNYLRVEKNPNKKYLPSIFSTELLSNKLEGWYKD